MAVDEVLRANLAKQISWEVGNSAGLRPTGTKLIPRLGRNGPDTCRTEPNNNPLGRRDDHTVSTDGAYRCLQVRLEKDRPDWGRLCQTEADWFKLETMPWKNSR